MSIATSIHRSRGKTAQRGAATLLVTTLLCLAMLLVAAFAGRDAVTEERAAAARVRSAQAFEAADAGIEWALSRLDEAGRIGDDCLPTASAGAASARDRWLRFTGPEGSVVPVTWSESGVPTALHAACVLRGGAWSCACPASGRLLLPPAADDAVAPAFDVAFAAGPRPGMVRIVAIGCTRRDAACAAPSDAAHEAFARVESTFALLPALRSAPVAALTVRGRVDAGTAAPGMHNADADTGSLGLHAGGSVVGASIRFGVPIGAALAGALVGGDAELGGLAGDALFARHFGMAPAAWARQPAAMRVDCSSACGSALARAVAGGARLLFVAGDAALAGPLALGTADAPVALVVGGTCALEGAVAIVGVLDCGSLRWSGAAAPAAFVRGAAVSRGDYAGDAAADFIHDGAVLARLQTRTGSFVRIVGSWKDF